MGIPTIPKRAAAPAETPKQAPVLPKAEAPAPAPAAAEAPAPAPAPVAAPAPAAVAVRPTTAVAAVAARPVDVMAVGFKDAFKVDWNTLHRIQATNGNFVDVEANKSVIGTEIVLELMSYQDNHQYSPGTDEESDTQYVRYSDDGVTFSTGENVTEYMEAMRTAGYTDGKLSKRVVLAGTIVGGNYDGKLVQLNLPDTSRSQFDRFRMQVSIDVSKGKRSAEDCKVLKLKAIPTSKGKFTWTLVMFDYANPASVAA